MRYVQFCLYAITVICAIEAGLTWYQQGFTATATGAHLSDLFIYSVLSTLYSAHRKSGAK